MLDESVQLLISRGLDADLDRREMRQLYGLVVADEAVRVEMAQMVELEQLLVDEGAIVGHAPSQDLTILAMRSADKGLIGFQGWSSSLFNWFAAPRLAFAAGVVLAVLAVWIANPLLLSTPIPELAQLPQVERSFVPIKSQVNWTNRFITSSGESTHLALQSGGQEPVQLRFESTELTALTLIHSVKDGGGRELVYSFAVEGTGFASLRQSHPGDAVEIRNEGQVPLLVYMHAAGAATVRDARDL